MSRVRGPAVLGGTLVAVAALLVGGVAVVRRGAAPTAAPTVLERLGRHGDVPAFTLTERSGRRVSRDDLRGKVWVADFIYTACRETCPVQSGHLAQLEQEFAAASALRLVSITVDPAHDTPEVLRRHAERYGATDRWWFLTGEKRTIYCLARDGFRLAVADPGAHEAIACGGAAWLGPARAAAGHGSGGLVMHSARLVLVDGAGQIRAYHLATDPASMGRLRANLRQLLAERADHERRPR